MLTCGVWVKRGIAKEVPDKVTLTEEDLKDLLDGTEEKLRDVLGEDEDLGLDRDVPETTQDSEEEADTEPMKNQNKEIDDDDAIIMEYGLDDYDNEGSLMTGAGMAGLMYYNKDGEDPYVDLKGVEDEEKDDEIIKKEDNLFVVGKMEEESSCLDIYVYNDEEDSLYVHHDILLESFPLCLEWLSFDPALNGKSGNYVALGTMEPEIQIWDLDVVNTIEPAYVLTGQRKKKKKKAQASSSNASGHSDAVLCLSWNPNAVNVLASGSADKSICLWDLSKATTVHRLTHHTDKVQSVRWHPQESQSLLTGSFDKTVAVLDCRSPKAFKSWKISGECEQVLWDHFSPYNFFASCDDGVVMYFDVRNDSPVFTLHAHDQAVTGIALSTEMQHCLTTVSSDKSLKLWSYKDGKPANILSRDMKMGNINFLCNCPDVSLLYAIGGEEDGLRTLNLMETTQGKQHFTNRSSVSNKKNKGAEKTPSSTATDDVAMDALSSLSLQTEDAANTEDKEIIKRKKNKKKKK